MSWKNNVFKYHFSLIKYLRPRPTSPFDDVNIVDHIRKLMELSTNISIAVLAEACRLVVTAQKRRIVDQYFIVYSIQGKLSPN